MKSLFYSTKIKVWEIGIMIFYVLLSIQSFFFLRFADDESQNHCLHMYAFFTQLFLYSFFYKAMRNLKVYIFCFTIGILHLCLYYLLRENASLIGLKNNVVISLRNTIILLILFQILRFVSLKTQKQELVGVGKNNKDVHLTREITRIDVILEVTYIAATFILLCL